MEMLDERLMADFGCLDPVYTDGIAGLINLGTNFTTLFFRWVPVRIECGVVVYERIAALSLVRPRASILRGDFGAMVDALPVPAVRLH